MKDSYLFSFISIASWPTILKEQAKYSGISCRTFSKEERPLSGFLRPKQEHIFNSQPGLQEHDLFKHRCFVGFLLYALAGFYHTWIRGRECCRTRTRVWKEAFSKRFVH
jgi:hypothetical protein